MEILAAVLASGAVFSFVQFMITFGFSRKDKTKELERKVDAIDAKIDENAAITTFLGTILGVSSVQYAKALKAGDDHVDN